MKYFTSITLVLLCLVHPAKAVINGFALELYNTGSTATYTVPAGKVLILQQVSLPQGAANPSKIVVGGADVTIPGANTNGIYRFQTPIYVPAGSAVSEPYVTTGTGIYGLLVDATDMPLFAGAGASLGSVTIAANTMTGVIQLPTSDPVVVRFQSSTDLVNWAYDSSVLVQPGPDKTKLQFTVPVSGAGRFYRALVHRRCDA
jgi:hypothetical protein